MEKSLEEKNTRTIILSIIFVVVLLIIGFTGMKLLIKHKNLISPDERPKITPKVHIQPVETGPVQVTISAEGTAHPIQSINIIPQISGKTIYISPVLVNGGIIKKGELLFKIDPADYQIAVTTAQARVKDAESALELVRAEATAAAEEWSWHIGDNAEAKMPPDLVLKKPQLMASQAKLDAERAGLEKAMLNLSRTEISAPFPGRVMQKNIGLGQYVVAGVNVAEIYSTEASEIVLPLDDADLKWIEVPGFTSDNMKGSMATITAEVAGEPISWQGSVTRSEGFFNEKTRMINIIVRIDDPFEKIPPLAPGLFVEAQIKGRTIQDAAVIPKTALHENNTVWILEDENRLSFRNVVVAKKSGNRVILSSGLKNDEKLIISQLKAVADGMSVRLFSDEDNLDE
ncbi:MAG: efflux RND transporter periplasmic adaptor subunit [Desulfobacterales bacterium]|nr:efflux RND transporter periplasmic adaptor subunit [Desulfobacterales bacterium]